MEYTVVVNKRVKGLIEEVNSLIKEGWIPQGGFHDTTGHYGSLFHQAMIKK